VRSAIVVVVGLAWAGCTSSETAGDRDASSDASDSSAPADADALVLDSATDAGVDADSDLEDIVLPETHPHPDAAGWCQSRGSLWPCEKGGACTFDGHCVPPDSGGEGGIKPCGAIGCDPMWCTCINAAGSTCDCTP
jgi:hypothetical protein